MAKEGGGSGAGVLIPGLPEELVLAQVVARLPWYARPVCRAVSKSWRVCIDTSVKDPDLQLKSRKYQLPILHGSILLCTFDTHSFIMTEGCMPHEELRAGSSFHPVQWQKSTYQIQRKWRNLPPLQGLLPPHPACVTLIASSGMAYAWSNKETDKFVLKMDMGCGDWTWSKLPVPHPFNEKAVPFNGKIYVPGVPTGEAAANDETKMVLVYDMMTDECGLAKACNGNCVVVFCKKNPDALPGISEEELYSFVEHESELEIFIYDACGDSWRSQGKIPIPECRWSTFGDFFAEVKLVNGDFFDPAPDVGINTICVDYEFNLVSWFNPSLHETWIDFHCDVNVEGKCLQYIDFIHGYLYGLFCEDEDGQDDEGEESKHGRKEEGNEEDKSYWQDPKLFDRTIMKGRMSVSGKRVDWVDVLTDIPCVVPPFDFYTLMHCRV